MDKVYSLVPHLQFPDLLPYSTQLALELPLYEDGVYHFFLDPGNHSTLIK